LLRVQIYASNRPFILRTALFWVIRPRVAVILYRDVLTESSVRNYHYSLHNSLEERSSHILRAEVLNDANHLFRFVFLLEQTDIIL